MWWDWVKTSRDFEAMTWGDFEELFMRKFFLASARNAKAREFLELRQGAMIVIEYVAKFTELALFSYDYMAIDMAKVRQFEDGMKFSIRGKIVGFLLHDIDSMVKTAMAIEREIDDAKSIGMRVLVGRERRISLLLARGRSKGLLLHSSFRGKDATIKAKAMAGLLARQGR